MKVQLSLQAPSATVVELFGELSSWQTSIPFTSRGDGSFDLDLELAPGTYYIKARVDGRYWVLVPGLPVEHALGCENSVLVVDGLDRPTVFSPCRRHLVHSSSGHLLLHLEADNSINAEEAMRLSVQVLAGDRSVLLHAPPRWSLALPSGTLLRYALSLAPAATHLRFPSASRSWPIPTAASATLPDWLVQGCIYSIFVDRWTRHGNDADPRANARTAPSTRSTFYGGDLDGIRDQLDYLKGLGVTAIALTPVVLSESPHRYDALDFAQIDPRIGGKPALERLIESCHVRELAVILDASFTHVHANHFAFRDVLTQQELSPYADWFRIKRFPVSLDAPDTYEHYWQMPFLPLTNFASMGLRAHLLAVITDWCNLGVDGIRLDAADMAPDEFWYALRTHVRSCARRPPILIAESVSEPAERYIHNDLADVVFDFPVRSELVDCLGRECGRVSEFAARLETLLHRRGPEMDQRRLWFLDLHDTNRFLTEATFYWRLRLALLFLLFRSEPVWFYYGTEFAFTSRQRAVELEGAWSDRLPYEVPLEPTQTEALVRKLLRYRSSLKRRGYGPALMRLESENLVVYERYSKRFRLALVLNLTDADACLPEALRGGKQVLVVEGPGCKAGDVIGAHQGSVFLWRHAGPLVGAVLDDLDGSGSVHRR